MLAKLLMRAVAGASKGFFIAGNSGGYVSKSSDGITWDALISTGMASIRKLASGNGIIVAIANYSTSGHTGIVYSTDGVTWTQATTGQASNTYFFDIVFGNGMFVVVGENGSTPKILTSTNGATWTARTTGYSSGDSPYRIAYGNGNYVTVSYSSGIVVTSANGTSWSQSSTVGIYVEEIKYGNGLWIIYTSSTPKEYYTSSSFTSWNSGSGLNSYSLMELEYNNGLWVGVGGEIITSSNGTTWTTRTSPVTSALYGIRYANGLYVAVGASGKIITSPNGINWTSRTNSFGGSDSIEDIEYVEAA